MLVLSFVFVASTFSFSLFKTVLGNFAALAEKWQTKYENLIGISNKIKFKKFQLKKRIFQFNYDFSKFMDEEQKEHEEFSEYMNKYGKEVQLPNLNFNDKGVCTLKYDNKIGVDIVYLKDNNQCIFVSPIGNIPSIADEKYFEQLLISNGFGTETGGSFFVLEEGENHVVLAYNFIASTFSFELFKTALKNFVNLVEELQKKHKNLCEMKFCPLKSDLKKYISF